MSFDVVIFHWDVYSQMHFFLHPTRNKMMQTKKFTVKNTHLLRPNHDSQMKSIRVEYGDVIEHTVWRIYLQTIDQLK